MVVAKKKKKKGKSGRRTGLDLTKPVERPRMPFTVLARMFLIGSVAIVASGYAIYRHYCIARPSMLMAVPSATAPAPEPSSSELMPVPELVPLSP